LLGELKRAVAGGARYGSSDVGRGKTVVIDYSSPNIAKRFGIGHLRSTIIGQAIYNLYKFLGYKVIGDNHLGDWGTQFGAILAEIKNSNLKLQNLTLADLEKLYVDFNKKAQDKAELWDEARAWFKKLEEGDGQAKKIWKVTVDISMKEFARIYDLLGVKIDYAYGESFYEDKMPAIISQLRRKGLSKKSKGAEIVAFAGKMPPAILVKSDGATTYYTRDLATIRFRVDKWKPDIFIYEVGSEQRLHFQQLFETARLVSWAKNREFIHVAHGLIRFESGKMSTRRGLTISLEEVLKEATKRATKIIEESETSRGLTTKEKREVAKAVGIGAIKYFDLSHHYSSDIIFDWEKMFVLEGNSAPYLQYTFARTQSVLRKSGESANRLADSRQPVTDKMAPEELVVLRSLSRFSGVTFDAAKNYSPNHLCNYLFQLAQKYNNFYAHHRILSTDGERTKGRALSANKHRIIASDNEEFRLSLTAATGQVIKNGLTLLGIQTPERM